MSRNYDNWERLVGAVLKKEELWQLFHEGSRSPSISSQSSSSDFSFSSHLNSNDVPISFSRFYAGSSMADLVKPILATPIQLADQVMKAAGEAASFKQECSELKEKTVKLTVLLGQAARASNDLYERPTLRILDDTGHVLENALVLVQKCRRNSVKRMFTIIPTAAFRKMSSHLENSIGDLMWLLSISAPNRGDEYLGLPPIVANDPILGLIWEQITILYTGSIDDRGYAAASLVSLARDNDRCGKLIIEEGGIGPLLKLVVGGTLEGRENAAMAIGLLGKNPESVEHMIHAGVCSVFARILRDGPMKVQAAVAWAVSELANHYPKCQDLFAQHNIIRLLVSLLAFEIVQEHSKYTIVSKAIKRNDLDDEKSPMISLHGESNRAREMEEPSTKEYMKAMAARALWHLARGNSRICKSITESRALLCFAVLLEKGSEEVQYNSAMALMEITAVAEVDADLRRSSFRPNSPACKAVVDQLFKVIHNGEMKLRIPCINAIGNLARTFSATETRMISPLVKLLDEREPEVSRETCIALTKFACTYNYLHLDHSKAIIDAGGAKRLVDFVYFGEEIVQGSALILLCYIALHVPGSEALARAEVLTALEWASKQAHLMQVEDVYELLPDCKGKLELYQSRGSRYTIKIKV